MTHFKLKKKQELPKAYRAIRALIITIMALSVITMLSIVAHSLLTNKEVNKEGIKLNIKEKEIRENPVNRPRQKTTSIIQDSVDIVVSDFINKRINNHLTQKPNQFCRLISSDKGYVIKDCSNHLLKRTLKNTLNTNIQQSIKKLSKDKPNILYQYKKGISHEDNQ